MVGQRNQVSPVQAVEQVRFVGVVRLVVDGGSKLDEFSNFSWCQSLEALSVTLKIGKSTSSPQYLLAS